MAAQDDLLILLKCTRCSEEAESTRLMEFEREGENVVRCDRCGKRHSTDSLHAVDPDDLREVEMDPEPQATGKTR